MESTYLDVKLSKLIDRQIDYSTEIFTRLYKLIDFVNPRVRIMWVEDNLN